MKIQIWSDLHLEFQPAPPVKNYGADVLILSGDICVADDLHRCPLDKPINVLGPYDRAQRYREFFKAVSDEFDTVFYVMGNHEPYTGIWNRTEEVLRTELSLYPNIHLMEQHKAVIGDVVFLGATLWTSMNDQDPQTLMSIRRMMSDYQAITEINQTGGYHKLNPATTVKRHVETVRWLDQQLTEDRRKTVVLTHHTPSRQSIHPRYRDYREMNGAFCSDLERIMHENHHLVLWTHGHVHDWWDYRVGNTRIVCNPHGYPNEPRIWQPDLVIEV